MEKGSLINWSAKRYHSDNFFFTVGALKIKRENIIDLNDERSA